VGAVRVRQHVNPLAQAHQRPAALPDWESCYGDWRQPLHLDIGCGRGQFLFQMAQQEPTWNFLGLDIRQPLVLAAQGHRDALGLTNLYFLFCNANVTLAPLLQALPPQTLQRVTIQFPDPWFKKRHHKRRLVQSQLVGDLANFLADGGWVLLQSDVEAVALAMQAHFKAHPAFYPLGWLTANPLPVSTEREGLTIAQGQPVYRLLFRRQPRASVS